MNLREHRAQKMKDIVSWKIKQQKISRLKGRGGKIDNSEKNVKNMDKNKKV